MIGKYLQNLSLLTVLAVTSGQVVVTEAVLAQSQRGESLPTFTQSQLLDPILITDVQVNASDIGIVVILETTAETRPTLTTEVVENTLIVEIPNGELVLAVEDEFIVTDPGSGIEAVRVSPGVDGGVRVAITGVDALPVAETRLDVGGLVFDVTVDEATAENIELVVTAETPEDDYTVEAATTATRTDTPLEDIPQSIQVIPQEVYEDQGINSLDDALRNVSGVLQNSADARGQRFVVRGFDSASVLRDGFRQTFGFNGNVGYPDLANIQRVEVLKGPAAILYGVSEPGGVINLVSEQPLSEPFYELNAEVGNRSLWGIGVDWTSPLNEAKTVAYRLNALYRNSDYYRDFDEEVERTVIAPVVAWDISDKSDVNFFLEYARNQRPYDTGIVAVGDEVADIPFDRNLSDPDDINEATYLRTGYRFEHRFNEDWKVRNAFNYRKYDTVFESSFLLNLDETTGDQTRSYIQLDQPSTTYEVQTNVVGEFATGSVDHTLLMGVDYLHREQVGNIGRGFATNFTLNIFNPVYNTVPEPNFSTEPIFFDGDTFTDAIGVYVQDQVDISDSLHLLAGLRYSTVEQRSVNRPSLFVPNASETTQNNDAFVPRLGIVYQPIEPISLYTSYSQSFAPNSGTTASGELLEPERGEQYEVGIRAELLDERLSVSLAYFDITKSNVATSDPNNPAFSINAGEQSSNGVELDVIGEVLPGWSLIANYAYTDASVTADNDGQLGNTLINVPEHNFNIWSNYEIQRGSLQGLSFGIGVNYVGERFGDLDNSFRLDSYFLTNAAIAYEQETWRAALNFRNLFDIEHITGTRNSRSEVFPGEGLTVVGTISAEF